MSGDPSQSDDPTATPSDAPSDAGVAGAPGADDSGILPVEVDLGTPAEGAEGIVDVEPDKVAELEAKLAAAEKEKKDNWDRYLRAAADLENLRKRQKREAEDAKFEARARS